MKFSALPLLAIAASAIQVNGYIVELDGASVFAQTGEITTSSAVVMARCNTKVDSSVNIKYAAVTRGSTEKLASTSTNEASDYTSHFLLDDLKDDTVYQYLVECVASGVVSKSSMMTFQTAPHSSKPAEVSFVWAGDLAGQGWGRSPNVTVTSSINGQVLSGGYVMFEVMRQIKPDFIIFQGDFIYADNKIPATVNLNPALGGGVWVNSPSKDFVAITVEDYRSNWKYNFGDSHLQTLLQEVPIYAQWDDHEVVNNWYPGQVLYKPKWVNYPNNTSVDMMVANARQVFFEYWPILGNKIYRSQRHGKHVEVFMLDLRTYRESNVNNSQTFKVSIFGEEQKLWLKNGLKASTATWKIISSNDPFTIITGGPGDWDTFVQGDPKMLGREFELAEILEFIKTEKITGVTSITSDVHFAAVLSYDPARATGFNNFNPFYEFVVGPTNAGAFGPGAVDPTFGSAYDFVYAPGTQNFTVQNLPPTYISNFGQASVSKNGTLTMSIRSITGAVLYSKTMTAPIICADSPTKTYIDLKGVSKTCARLAKKTAAKIAEICESNPNAESACPDTCNGFCPAT